MRKKREEKKGKGKGRMPCCEREGMRKGAWTAEEDKILVDYIRENGHGNWRNLPQLAGLLRCGKSCRLRWTNYLRPNIKRGPFSLEDEQTIIQLHRTLGNKWAAIASKLPGRTDNDVKNFWNSHLRKRFATKLLDLPSPSSKSVDINSGYPSTRHLVQWETSRLEAEPKPSGSDNKGDHFLCLWNSEVGESFRHRTSECDEAARPQSPTSETSSLTKVESGSRSAYLSRSSSHPETADQKVEIKDCKNELEDGAAFSVSSNSYQMDDSPDAMLKLLLDFPINDDDMVFL